MNKQNSYIATGLGWGDEGKGSVIDALCRYSDIDYVVRYNGGSQAAHNVCLPDGRHHTFAQFGSGSFVPGVATILSHHMMVNPLSFMVEREVLHSKGIAMSTPAPDPRVYVDRRALVTTPYHMQLNRAREAARGVARHGTTGMGISETVLDSLARPNDVLCCGDLNDDFRAKLEATRDYLYGDMERLGATDQFQRIDIDYVIDQYKHFRHMVSIVTTDDIKVLLQTAKGVAFEGAQGILLDQDYGFHPHTTWSTTTAHNAHGLVHDYELEEPCKLGITRTYHTRHGEGPFPTENFLCDMPEPHNGDDSFPGQFRTGYLDMSLLRYAIDCNQGIDGLVVNHADYPQTQYCVDNGIRMYHTPRNLREQEGMTRQAWHSAPASGYYGTPDNWPEAIAEMLEVKLFMVGHGPTHEDKGLK